MGEGAGGGALGEYRSLLRRSGDRNRARAAVDAAAGRRRAGAGRALAAGATAQAEFRRAVADLAKAALEKQRAAGEGTRGGGGVEGTGLPQAGSSDAPVASPELERFKKRVQECQVRRLQEQVQEQRLKMESQENGKAAGAAASEPPEFLKVLEAQAARLTEITRQIGRIEGILSPRKAKEQLLREKIRAVCEEHEREAEEAGPAASHAAAQTAGSTLAAARSPSAKDGTCPGAGGGEPDGGEDERTLSKVEEIRCDALQDSSPSPREGAEVGELHAAGKRSDIWKALRAIQERCDSQERATAALREELQSFYGAFSGALQGKVAANEGGSSSPPGGAGGGTASPAPP